VVRPRRGFSSKDGLVYEFVLRRGVRFHNGDPLTADDVKFSFERYRTSWPFSTAWAPAWKNRAWG